MAEIKAKITQILTTFLGTKEYTRKRNKIIGNNSFKQNKIKEPY